jgi:trehalose 6-phosphate phosphatase
VDPVELTPDLAAALAELARTPVLLVACDYDGTLAPIVDDPTRARPLRESVAALRSLAALPDSHVAVISGRALRDLAALSRLPEEVQLVGSHGSEFDIGFVSDLPPDASRLLAEIASDLEAIAARYPGCRIETKPASVAFHHREADPADGDAAAAEVLAGPARRPGVHVKKGKMVVELAVVPTNKGYAVDQLRARVGATAVLFLGDDVTDEDAFARLHGPDLSVKVGEGETSARYRVADPTEVARLLARLWSLRHDWLHGYGAPPIERHSLLSDQRALALVTPDARVTWMCQPSVDSAALFAELLGGATAGYFAVRPAHGRPPISQRYLEGTMSVETRWPGVTVTDYLDCSGRRSTRAPGRTDLVRVIEHTVPVIVEFAPRLDFGRLFAGLSPMLDGLVLTGSHDPVALRSPGVEWEIQTVGGGPLARAEIAPGGEPLVLELRCGTTDLGDEPLTEPQRRQATHEYWTGWARRLRLPPIEADVVRRSALTLKALCHTPTGAIVAASTTSLPEVVGGSRNWDYRFCWPRDAALTAGALALVGSYGEGFAWLDWLARVVGDLPGPERLRPVYTVTGRELSPEATLPHLSGYAGSRPVRVGNAAEHQIQLDVFGPVVELVHHLALVGAPILEHHWGLVEAMVEAVDKRWTEPDHGIWEIRQAPRHHVYSKVMGWVAVDRALKTAEIVGHAPGADWEQLRDTIRADVLEHGWHDAVGAFTAAYGADDLDAASLHVGLSGLLDPTDERFQRTIRAVEVALRDGPTVYRYKRDDGLPGVEGGFHICTTWLIESYALSGRLDDARALFRQLVELVGPTGLLSEQYDPITERALGNHPQAYSHLGLIRSAVALAPG